ncbi:MAG: STAS domain-containing protein [bacterium]
MLKSYLNIKSKTFNNWTIIEFEGEINFQNMSLFNNSLDNFLYKKIKNIALDFSKLEQITSNGIATILKLNEKIKMNDGHLKILGPSSHVESIFKSVGIDKIIRIIKKPEEL